jgi:hypothetical protein
MKDIQVEVIASAAGGTPKSRLRLTWTTEPSWLTRKILGVRRVEVSAVFAGTGEIWHVLPDWRRAPPAFEQELQRLEARLVRGEEPSASVSQGKAVDARSTLNASLTLSDGGYVHCPPGTQAVVKHRVSEGPVHSNATIHARRRTLRLKPR